MGEEEECKLMFQKDGMVGSGSPTLELLCRSTLKSSVNVDASPNMYCGTHAVDIIPSSFLKFLVANTQRKLCPTSRCFSLWELGRFYFKGQVFI